MKIKEFLIDELVLNLLDDNQEVIKVSLEIFVLIIKNLKH